MYQYGNNVWKANYLLWNGNIRPQHDASSSGWSFINWFWINPTCANLVHGAEGKNLFCWWVGRSLEPLYQFTTCEKLFTYYQDTMNRLMNDCFQVKTVTWHSADKPWVTDSFWWLVKRHQQARMSGDQQLAKKLRNQVNREPSRLRHQFYQSKVIALEESTSKDWRKHTKSLLGLSSGWKSELINLANRCTDGDIL